MYCTEIRRAENHPITGRAQYRVNACFADYENSLFDRNKKVIRCFRYTRRHEFAGIVPKLFLQTNKRYRIGNLINPYKALGLKPLKAAA